MDISRARVTQARRVVVTKPRNGEPTDSIAATVRGEDLMTLEEFTTRTAFNAFLGLSGEDSPEDREPAAMYGMRVPDTSQWMVPFFNTLPPAPPLTEIVLEAGFVGATTCNLFTATPVVVGSLAGFSALTQIYARPITVQADLNEPVTSFISGELRFAEIFSGDVKIYLNSTLKVDTGADVAVTWKIQRSPAPGDPWSDYRILREDSYRANDTPVGIHYESPWMTHLVNNRYRIVLERAGGPAGAMLVTLTDPVINATMRIGAV